MTEKIEPHRTVSTVKAGETLEVEGAGSPEPEQVDEAAERKHKTSNIITIVSRAKASHAQSSLQEAFDLFATSSDGAFREISQCCAALALFSDGYQLQVMNMLNVLFVRVYGHDVFTDEVKTRVGNAALVGSVLGQLVVGLCCDRLGRKQAIILTTAFIVIGSALAGGAFGPTEAFMFWVMTVARGMAGFGVGKFGHLCFLLPSFWTAVCRPDAHLVGYSGGEYPAAQTANIEATNAVRTETRGRNFILSSGLPLTVGNPLATLVFLISCLAAGVKTVEGEGPPEAVWRTCFVFGALLPVCIIYFRYKMMNSKLYQKSAMKKKVPYKLVLQHYWSRLIGTCGVWFLWDFIQYPNHIFSATIVQSALGKQNTNVISLAGLMIGWQLIAVPGTLVAAFGCNKIGRKNLIMIGFFGITVCAVILGAAYDTVKDNIPAFVVLYALIITFGKMGAGSFIGLVTTESYATPVRGTCYGIRCVRFCLAVFHYPLSVSRLADVDLVLLLERPAQL